VSRQQQTAPPGEATNQPTCGNPWHQARAGVGVPPEQLGAARTPFTPSAPVFLRSGRRASPPRTKMMGRPLLLGHQTLSRSQPNARVWHDPPPQTIPAPSAGFRTEGSGSITTAQRPTRGRGHHQAAGGAAVVGARSTPQHLRWTREEDSARTHVGPRQGGELEVGCGIVALGLPPAAADAQSPLPPPPPVTSAPAVYSRLRHVEAPRVAARVLGSQRRAGSTHAASRRP